MKSLLKTLALAAIAAVPAVSFAQAQPQSPQSQYPTAQTQTNGPVTRAQVRDELRQLEQAGYRPAMNDLYYPEDIQAAEARVHAQQNQNTGYGPATNGTSQGGGPASSYSPPVNMGH